MPDAVGWDGGRRTPESSAGRSDPSKETPMTADELFWDLAEPMYADPAVRRSTMMGVPCVRVDGRFFASLDRRSGALLVKLPADRVRQLRFGLAVVGPQADT
jgi:hypothetical protein